MQGMRPCGRGDAAGMIQTRKMSDAVIRKARDTDIPAIASLWFEMMNYHLARDRRFAIAHDASTIFTVWLRGLLEDQEIAYVAVAEEKGSVVGYILGQIEELPPVYHTRRIGVIRDVCVVQGARHGGLGTEMYKHSVAWFKNRHVGAIWVRLPVENKVAHQFWENQGFKPFTTVMRYEFDEQEA